MPSGQLRAARSAAEAAQNGWAALETGDQVGRLLEPDMEAAERTGERARSGRAGDEPGRRQGEALIAAPRGADAEEGKALDHRMRRLGAVFRLEDDAEQAARAGEI